MITKRGVKRTVQGHDGPIVVETYTVADAATALHRNEVTLRAWIAKDLVPAPMLFEASRTKVMLYSRGELEVIAREVARHIGDNYQNLCERHEHVRHSIHQHMHAYRTHHV